MASVFGEIVMMPNDPLKTLEIGPFSTTTEPLGWTSRDIALQKAMMVPPKK